MTQPPTPARIIAFVAHHYDRTADELLAYGKWQPLARQRHVAMWMCRQYTGHSYPRIGQNMGGRDHATIMYGVKQINKLLAMNTPQAIRVRSDIAIIQTMLATGHASPIVAAMSVRGERVPA